VIQVQAIILAAGKGSRFNNLTKTIPKCLFTIGNTTILDRQIDILIENGINDILVITGYESNLIQKHLNQKNVKIVKNKKYDIFDNLYSFWCAKNFIKTDFICIYGDLIFDKNLFSEFIKIKDNCLIIDNPVHQFDSHSVNIKNNLIQNIDFNHNDHISNGQFIGISKFNESSLKLLKKSLNNFNNYGNLDGEFVRLIKYLLENNLIIHSFHVNKKIWINVNDKTKLDFAREKFD
jgi:L-glutamine-phosphate cytidylyltransferase